MNKIFVLCLVCFLCYSQEDTFLERLQCSPEQNGIVASKVTQFVDAMNRLRNMVASGNEINHKGQKQAAANMNYLGWSDGIARGAQNCAQRCPIHDGTCKQVSLHHEKQLINDWGYVSYSRPIVVKNYDWDPARILQTWLQDQRFNRQILWGRAKTFGCGRSVNRDHTSGAAPIEHVVCLFDEKVRDGMEPYVAGTTGAACQVGSASGYFALCATAYSKLLVQVDFTDTPQHQFALGGQDIE